MAIGCHPALQPLSQRDAVLQFVAKGVRHVVNTVLRDPQHAHVGAFGAADWAERYALEMALELLDHQTPARVQGLEVLPQLVLEQPDLRPKNLRFFQDTEYLVRRAAAQALSQIPSSTLGR